MVVKHPSVYEVEKPLSASFPVIPNDPVMSGHNWRSLFYGVEAIEATYGAFGANMSKTHSYSGHTVGDKAWPELRIYASNSNGIYGRSYSVSVPAAYSLIIIRT